MCPHAVPRAPKSEMELTLHISNVFLELTSVEWRMLFKKRAWASLVAQWLRICLLMQETRFEPWSGKIPHAAEQLGP